MTFDNEHFTGKAKGPINIALIKYWGKDNEELITPLNNSLSLTLDTKTFYTETKVTISLLPKSSLTNNEDIITLKINSQLSNITKRIKNIIEKFKKIPSSIIYPYLEKNNLKIEIESINTFPIASGCASSASSMAALVMSIASALKINDKIPITEFTKIARVGSGSACRSIMGGICEWKKGDDSYCVQLYDENYWDLGVKLIIVNQQQKEISSSLGMKITKETSELFKYRIESIANSNLEKIKNYIEKKDFNGLAEIVMKDSNNFHACCRDSYPTINYLNDKSEYIIKSVVLVNKLFKINICAYTFDAGSNAFIIYENKNFEILNEYFEFVLGMENKNMEDFISSFNGGIFSEYKNEINDLINKKPICELVKQIVNFSLGEGTKIIE